MLTRRTVVSCMAGIAASRAANAITVSGHALDLDDPAENLRAFVKLTGSLDSDPVYDIVRGSVYALVPGQAARPLFRTVGAGRATFARRSDLEYSSVSRYVGMLVDWDTQQPLRRWRNPFNGSTCEVPVTRYGPGETRILGGRIVPPALASASPSEGIWPWFRLGNVVHMQRIVTSGAPEVPAFPKADLMTFSGDWQQLADPSLTRIPSRLNFTAVETWREWMRMDFENAPEGTLWWQVDGAKLDSDGDYPPALRRQILQEDPTFFSTGP